MPVLGLRYTSRLVAAYTDMGKSSCCSTAETLALKSAKRFWLLFTVFESLFRLMPPWLLTMATRYLLRGGKEVVVSYVCIPSHVPRGVGGLEAYPSRWSFCNAPGTLLCHHFQSFASRPNTLPDADVIRVESYGMVVALASHVLIRPGDETGELSCGTYKIKCSDFAFAFGGGRGGGGGGGDGSSSS